MAWSRARHERPHEDGVPSGHRLVQVSGRDDEDPRTGHRRSIAWRGRGIDREPRRRGCGGRLHAEDPCPCVRPRIVSASKLSRITTRGAEVTQIAGDPINAERTARAYAEKHGLTYISPYNDPSVVAGQATVGLELLRQCGTPPAAIFVPLGGGGLSAGIAISVKTEWPSTHVIACSPANSQVMIRSVEAGRLLDLPSLPTISDGTAGGVEMDAITFDLCRAWIDEFLTVSEEEIAESMVQVIEGERILIEGSAAVAVAGYQKIADRFTSESVVVVLSGANVSRGTLLDVLSGSAHHPGIT